MDVAMDPRGQPLNEEFWRYSAECRRMARLARKPLSKPTRGVQAYLHTVAWLEGIQRQYVNPPRHRVQFAKGAHR